ncbi:MAG: phosphoheptose isomerase [Pseudarcicella sp.]|nr:phosphoheptose isomerase [Pseudarcicella sp.]MBP6410099.1 phosphoheptose isomerase [Pseudarcicella sp.]
MQISTKNNIEKTNLFEAIEKQLIALDLNWTSQDRERPWGGFFVIDPQKTHTFLAQFFPNILDETKDVAQLHISPKILIVAPHQRLSWQYHYRRSEIWKVISTNPVGVKTSLTDLEPESVVTLAENDIIKMQKGERHRLIGLEHWGIIAEIWQHSDHNHPSDENDIVRIQDDFGR